MKTNTEEPKRCRRCRVKLTPQEIKYYDGTCEECERDWHEQMQAAQRGGPDTMTIREPAAWVYDIARAIDSKTGKYVDWERRVSFTKPNVSPAGLRNLAPLFTDGEYLPPAKEG